VNFSTIIPWFPQINRISEIQYFHGFYQSMWYMAFQPEKKSVFSSTQFPIEQYFHKHSSLKHISENMLRSLDDHRFETNILGNTNGFRLSTSEAFVWKFKSTRWYGHWDDPANWLVVTTHIWAMTFLTWSLISGGSSHNSGTTNGHYLT
jgi:hypothetical protein